MRMFACMHTVCMWAWARARVAFYTRKSGSASADVRQCEKEEENENKRRSKRPHAIKILEETGRESESEAVRLRGCEQRACRWCGKGYHGRQRWCRVFLVPLRSHRNNEVVNDTVCVTLHGYRLRRSGINNPLSIPICFGFLYNPEHRRGRKKMCSVEARK